MQDLQKDAGKQHQVRSYVALLADSEYLDLGINKLEQKLIEPFASLLTESTENLKSVKGGPAEHEIRLADKEQFEGSDQARMKNTAG